MRSHKWKELKRAERKYATSENDAPRNFERQLRTMDGLVLIGPKRVALDDGAVRANVPEPRAEWARERSQTLAWGQHRENFRRDAGHATRSADLDGAIRLRPLSCGPSGLGR